MKESLLSNIGDIELLELLKGSDEPSAFEEFVKRYYDVVKRECLLKCKLRKLDSHIGEQIAHETFEKVRRTKSFDKKKLNSAESKYAITGWLLKISTNLFYDYHNSIKSNDTIHSCYFDDLLNKYENTNVELLVDQRDFALKVIQSLTDKEKEVLLTDIDYKRSHKYLPVEINEALAKRLNVKKSTIRKIRERMIKKINFAIDEVNKEA